MAERLRTGNMRMLCPKMKRAIFSLLIYGHHNMSQHAPIVTLWRFCFLEPPSMTEDRQDVLLVGRPEERLFISRPQGKSSGILSLAGDCCKLRDFHGGRRRAGANLSLVSKSKCLKSEVIELGVRQKADFNCSFSNIFFQ